MTGKETSPGFGTSVGTEERKVWGVRHSPVE